MSADLAEQTFARIELVPPKRPVEAWYLIKLLWADEWMRAAGAITSMLMFPVALAYLGSRLDDDVNGAGHRHLTAGLTLALSSNVLQSGAAILEDRFSGRLALLRASAVAKVSYYATRVCFGVVKTGILVLLALASAALFDGIELKPAVVASGLVIVAAASSSLCGLAAAIAVAVRTPDAGYTLLGVCSLGLALVSPLYYSISEVAPWLRMLLLLSPYSHLPPLISAVLTGAALPATATLGAIGMGLVLHWVSYRRLAWS